MNWKRIEQAFARLGIFFIAWIGAAFIGLGIGIRTGDEGGAFWLMGGIYSMPIAIILWLVMEFTFFRHWQELSAGKVLKLFFIAAALYFPLMLLVLRAFVFRH